MPSPRCDLFSTSSDDGAPVEQKGVTRDVQENNIQLQRGCGVVWCVYGIIVPYTRTPCCNWFVRYSEVSQRRTGDRRVGDDHREQQRTNQRPTNRSIKRTSFLIIHRSKESPSLSSIDQKNALPYHTSIKITSFLIINRSKERPSFSFIDKKSFLPCHPSTRRLSFLIIHRPKERPSLSSIDKKSVLPYHPSSKRTSFRIIPSIEEQHTAGMWVTHCRQTTITHRRRPLPHSRRTRG